MNVKRLFIQRSSEESIPVRKNNYSCVIIFCAFLGIIYLVSIILQLQEVNNITNKGSSSMINGEFIKVEAHRNDSISKYKFKQNDQFYSYQRMMQLFEAGDEIMIKRLSALLKQSGDAVFWECAPVSQSEFASKSFEFVIIPAPSLALRTVDYEPFSAKFSAASQHYEDVITFQSLGGDATLVVPSPPHSTSRNYTQPTGDVRHMTHLASFLRKGDNAQIIHLFNKIGTAFSHAVLNSTDSARRFWLSTSGLGVSWLHVRVDTVPKYYNWKEYKK